jgi:hypothetical protein
VAALALSPLGPLALEDTLVSSAILAIQDVIGSATCRSSGYPLPALSQDFILYLLPGQRQKRHRFRSCNARRLGVTVAKLRIREKIAGKALRVKLRLRTLRTKLPLPPLQAFKAL